MKKLKIYVGCSLQFSSDKFKQSIEEFKDKLRETYEVSQFKGLNNGTPEEIYQHDIACVKECDLFVAECSEVSTGLGIELGVAISLKKSIIAIARHDARVSNMVQGAVIHPFFTFVRYDELDNMIPQIHTYIKNVK